MKGKIDHEGNLIIQVRGEMTKQFCPDGENKECKDSCALFGEPIESIKNGQTCVSIKLCHKTLHFNDFEIDNIKLVSRDREALAVLVLEWAEKWLNHIPDHAHQTLKEICDIRENK